MMSHRALSTEMHPGPAILPARKPREYTPLAAHAPARAVMVDFSVECAQTTDLHCRVDVALKEMANAGVRTLLVMDHGTLAGLITAYDIQGEKPVQFVHSTDCIHPRCRHEDVEVADVMTPIEALPMLQLADLDKAVVGEVMETFRRSGRTHLLVMNKADEEVREVRGLISRTRVERQLGMSQDTVSLQRIETEIANFFLAGRH
ncbi:MAG: CBS domain-containing protein [Rhodanobacter sp.]|nr:MAG: CBS domain-containing protein [Rhodanobacter sp.]